MKLPSGMGMTHIFFEVNLQEWEPKADIPKP